MRTASTRWRGARIVGTALKVLAWIILVLGIAAIVFALVRLNMGGRPHAVLQGGGPLGGYPRAARLRGLGIAAAIARFLAVIVAFLLLYGAGAALQMLATIADNTQPGNPAAPMTPAAPGPSMPAYPPTPPSNLTPGPAQLPSAGSDAPTYPSQQ